MSRLPIRLRLTLTFALVMVVVLAATGGFVYVRVGDALLRRSTRRSTRRRPRPRRGRTTSTGSSTRTRPAERRWRSCSPATAPSRGRRSARWRRCSRPADAARVAAGGTVWRSITLKKPAGDWRVLGVRTRSGDVVAVARSLEPREETLHRLLHELTIAFPLALLLAAVAGYALAAGALRPVEAMRRRAAAVTATRPGRLPVPRSRDEVSRLALTLNDMLERLEASFQHERRFLSDASHELRTPLALLRAELELALRRPRSAEELELALRSAAEETERLSRLAEDLLLIARADQGALPIRRELVSGHGRAHHRRGTIRGAGSLTHAGGARRGRRRGARRRPAPRRAGARQPRRQRARLRRRRRHARGATPQRRGRAPCDRRRPRLSRRFRRAGVRPFQPCRRRAQQQAVPGSGSRSSR